MNLTSSIRRLPFLVKLNGCRAVGLAVGGVAHKNKRHACPCPSLAFWCDTFMANLRHATSSLASIYKYILLGLLLLFFFLG